MDNKLSEARDATTKLANKLDMPMSLVPVLDGKTSKPTSWYLWAHAEGSNVLLLDKVSIDYLIMWLDWAHVMIDDGLLKLHRFEE